ncbi:glycosyltransferase family 4 protein [Desulfobacula toluolica]|uniref:Glycosyl transferase, group 1 n=1 Tax=Desulfobacula toluolica (strain DSM 7467 / Tol2) TaxID=651182 RepID=K0NGL9_DESTT|nr:glycosyltransferase family 4 protein [Desulfobacula toluolica]CCK78983.1 glycosyl transferase, group 1 [Desulfobacula toluolica Tol2]
MKLLMTSNIIFPSIAQMCDLDSHVGGGWLLTDVEALTSRFPDLKLGVLTMHPQASPGKYEDGHIMHYIVQGSSYAITHWPNRQILTGFAQAISDFQPDVIYVQGTEYNYGLAVSTVAPNIPSVVAIQGLVSTCRDAERSCMNISTLLRCRTAKDWLEYFLYKSPMEKRQAKLEVETLRRFCHILGRTQWSKAYARAIAPHAAYYHVDNIMHAEFCKAKWDIAVSEQYRIFSINGLLPRKGLHILLEAVNYLRRDFPDVSLRFPGIRLELNKSWPNIQMKGYEKFLCHLIQKWGLQNNVKGLGNLDASAMAVELTKAHVFAMPSFIENSSTSLCESMLVGTPSVAAYVGGMGTIAHDRMEALMFPAGDAVVLAEQIRALFEDKNLCIKLSQNARKTALYRHDSQKITDSLMQIFQSIV